MKYTDMYRYAHKTLGLVFKKRPRVSELQSAIAKAEQANNNDPVKLRELAAGLNVQVAELQKKATDATNRAVVIETAQNAVSSTTSRLYTALAEFGNAVKGLNDLGLDYEYPKSLTGLGQLYHFELTGPEYEGHVVVLASNFSTAKAKALAGEILEGDQADPEILPELKRAMKSLKENGQVERTGHVLTTKTLL